MDISLYAYFTTVLMKVVMQRSKEEEILIEYFHIDWMSITQLLALYLSSQNNYLS